MKFDFETVVNRSGTGSMKWKNAEIISGKCCTFPPLSTADMEFVLCPSIEERLVQSITNQNVFGYTGAPDGYEEAVAEWFLNEHQTKIDKEWIFQTYGVIQAIRQAITCFTSDGDGILIQTPVYHQFMTIINHTGRKIIDNPLKRNGCKYEIDFEDLKIKAKQAKMILLCSPHNPVGRVWDENELRQVNEIAKENNLIVLADEIHCDFTHGKKHIVFTNLDQERTILCTSASKTFNLAGLNLANIIVPNKELRVKMIEHMTQNDIHVQNYFGYYGTLGAYCKCGSEWKKELNQVIETNYLLIKQFFNEIKSGCFVADLEGTYLAWIDLNALGYCEDEVLEQLRQVDLFVDKGSQFGTNGEGFIRLNLACPTALIKEALKRFEQVLK